MFIVSKFVSYPKHCDIQEYRRRRGEISGIFFVSVKFHVPAVFSSDKVLYSGEHVGGFGGPQFSLELDCNKMKRSP
jgi:hypothetical protein